MGFLNFLPVVGDMIGGYMESRSARKMNNANIAMQRETNAINAELTRETNKMNYDMQKEFAQNGIAWKIQDAERSGIHPLAALGAQVTYGQPSFVAGHMESPRYEDYGQVQGQGDAVRNAISKIATIMNPIERAKDKAVLESMTLDNKLKAIEVHDRLKNVSVKVNNNGVIDGQADGVNYEPNNITIKQNPMTDAGERSFYEYTNKDGYVQLLPNQQNKELIQDMNPHAVEYIWDYVQNWRKDVNLLDAVESGSLKPANNKWRSFLLSVMPKNAPAGTHYRYAGRYKWKLYKTAKDGKRYFWENRAGGDTY